jgi:hypothetical protein
LSKVPVNISGSSQRAYSSKIPDFLFPDGRKYSVRVYLLGRQEVIGRTAYTIDAPCPAFT